MYGQGKGEQGVSGTLHSSAVDAQQSMVCITQVAQCKPCAVDSRRMVRPSLG